MGFVIVVDKPHNIYIYLVAKLQYKACKPSKNVPQTLQYLLLMLKYASDALVLVESDPEIQTTKKKFNNSLKKCWLQMCFE